VLNNYPAFWHLIFAPSLQSLLKEWGSKMKKHDNITPRQIGPEQDTGFKNRLRTLIFMCFVILLIGVIETVSYVLQGIARPLLVRENNSLIEQLANKLVSDLRQKIVMTETLARALAGLKKAGELR
jgi:hypothetical protein